MARPSYLSVPAALLAVLAAAGCASSTHAPIVGTALSAPAPDFTLTDARGTPWTLSQQHGKTVVLDFGYTHCEDTCPATIAKIAQALRDAHIDAKDATIAFVTLDPARDTPPVLAAYERRFDGAPIVGLTGTAAQIHAVEHDYHIWSQRIPGMHARMGYDIAHSTFFYIIDRDGRERVLHNDDARVADITANLRAVAE